MKNLVAALTLAVSTVGSTLMTAAPAAAHEWGTAYRYTTGHVIVVSCWRGPWKQVIWDRPNANFIDSLVGVGYDYPTSSAIAERICRDQNLVFNPEGLKAEMHRIYRTSPAHRHYRATGQI